ncbi:class I SAM-dependent methyltransferase [Actinophytocola gossypii]|uniref:Class I SAM-dependent methyltransferase n=1 Tax=Actinophytocola gossypii TaxID=2812003 RepID=A0ABT2JCH1_9PSEU|nr:class I SAM-dependent methyltransferase [Actinophytocola gossypii]MCT2585552.1 class I SAM-dependent methyltransferase [Actinophytocola gossypii]
MTSLAGHRYVFDNDSTHSDEQHRCLAAAYDPPTTAALAATGVGPGWRCLEVGAGGGSVAHWLADRVAPTGAVLATDLNPRHVRAAPGLTVARHDVTRDPLPEAEFDLIHARLVLLHLPDRLAVLDRLVRALKPGGWLQLDEFDISYGPALAGPDLPLYERFLTAKAELMEAAGALGTWGRSAGAAMTAAGLEAVEASPHVWTWDRNSPGLHLLVHHTHHLRDKFLAFGFTDDDLTRVRAVMADPAFRACSCVFYTVRGRRPA